MKITIILASIREERKSHRFAEYLLTEIKNRKVSITLIDLQKTNLPSFGTQPDSYENIEYLRKILAESDGLIFISPEYHQTYTSTLKNMVEYYWPEFNRKPIGVATTSAGKLGGVQASMHLQSLILALGGYPIPIRLLVPEIQNVFDENSNPLQDDIKINTEKFLDEFLRFSEVIMEKSDTSYSKIEGV